MGAMYFMRPNIFYAIQKPPVITHKLFDRRLGAIIFLRMRSPQAGSLKLLRIAQAGVPCRFPLIFNWLTCCPLRPVSPQPHGTCLAIICIIMLRFGKIPKIGSKAAHSMDKASILYIFNRRITVAVPLNSLDRQKRSL
jgi:hypothetical protein